DASPHKHGRLLPGSKLRVTSESDLVAAMPDYVLIFPWNLKTEISNQLNYIREWGGQFVVAIPELTIF
ncbi:MAG: SAM-dependent methyltransferase, partial [Flavobacteriales bacterium]